MSMATKSMKPSGGGGAGGGILSWIGPGVGIGVGQKLLDGVMSGISMPGRILSQWLTDSMDLTQVNRKFDIVFGNLRDQAKQWSADFAKEVNGSLTNTKAMMARMQDTFVPLGFSRDKSFEMSRATTRLATDLAASEGMSVQEAAERLQSAMIGNHEAVRIFGVGLSEVTLKQELFRMGIRKNAAEATDQEKALARLNFILRSTRDAHGSAARAQGDLRSQLNSMSAVYTEVSARMGMVFAPALAKVVQFMKELGTTINANLMNSAVWGEKLAQGVVKFLQHAGGVKAVVDRISKSVALMMSNMAEGFDKLGDFFGDPKKFYDKIRDIFSSMYTIAKPYMLEVQMEFEKTFFRIAGGIMGVFGQSSKMIKVMLMTFLDTLYDSIVEISKQIYEMTSYIPGSKSAKNESLISENQQEIDNTLKQHEEDKRIIAADERNQMGVDDLGRTYDERREESRLRASAKLKELRTRREELIAKRQTSPTALQEASKALENLPAFDPISVMERFSAGTGPGGAAYDATKRGGDMLDSVSDANWKAWQQSQAKPTLTGNEPPAWIKNNPMVNALFTLATAPVRQEAIKDGLKPIDAEAKAAGTIETTKSQLEAQKKKLESQFEANKGLKASAKELNLSPEESQDMMALRGSDEKRLRTEMARINRELRDIETGKKQNEPILDVAAQIEQKQQFVKALKDKDWTFAGGESFNRAMNGSAADKKKEIANAEKQITELMKQQERQNETTEAVNALPDKLVSSLRKIIGYQN
jgi:hypothetical protein